MRKMRRCVLQYTQPHTHAATVTDYVYIHMFARRIVSEKAYWEISAVLCRRMAKRSPPFNDAMLPVFRFNKHAISDKYCQRLRLKDNNNCIFLITRTHTFILVKHQRIQYLNISLTFAQVWTLWCRWWLLPNQRRIARPSSRRTRFSSKTKTM